MRLVLPPGALEAPLAMLLEAEPRLRDLLACAPLPAPAAPRSLGTPRAQALQDSAVPSHKACITRTCRAL